MVVLLTPSANKVCESFTHNSLTQDQGKPPYLSQMGIQKELFDNLTEFVSNFRGGQHGCAFIAMGEQQYTLHSHITFVPPIKPGRSPAYTLNPIHGNIAVTYWRYQNYLHDYNLIKNMNTV